MTQHAKLSPSGSKRWFACPGSVVLEASIPNKHNEYSDDGTAVHTLAALCLTEHRRATHWVGQEFAVEAPGEPERLVTITDDMAELVQGYVDTVRVFGIGNETLVEQRVEFSRFVQLPDQFGTADAIVIDDRAGEVIIVDLKTGHTPVIVEENTQMLLYALGVVARLTENTKNSEECDLV